MDKDKVQNMVNYLYELTEITQKDVEEINLFIDEVEFKTEEFKKHFISTLNDVAWRNKLYSMVLDINKK